MQSGSQKRCFQSEIWLQSGISSTAPNLETLLHECNNVFLDQGRFIELKLFSSIYDILFGTHYLVLTFGLHVFMCVVCYKTNILLQ